MKIHEIYDFIKKKYNLIEEEQAFNTISLSIDNDVSVLYLDREFNRIYLSDDIFYSKGLKQILTHFSANCELQNDVNDVNVVNSIIEKIDLLMKQYELAKLEERKYLVKMKKRELAKDFV